MEKIIVIPSDEKKIFVDEILMQTAEKMKERQVKEYDTKKVLGFFAGKGKYYDVSPVKLMVIGRALNGWLEPHPLSSLLKREEAEAFAQIAYNIVNKEDQCPLKWVIEQAGDDKNYNTNRSAFWRVIKRVVHTMGCAPENDSEWVSHIVWSNLYKLNYKGNPDEELCDAQYPGCAKMLELEIKKYQPDKILFLTGMGWAYPFIIDIKGFNCKTEQKKYVKGLGNYHLKNKTARVVISVHPQGKNEMELCEEIEPLLVNSDGKNQS